MKLAALALLLLMAWAAPASAQSPTVVKFAPGQESPIDDGTATIGSECQGSVIEKGGWDGGPYLPMACGYPYMFFTRPQAMVEFFVRLPAGESITFLGCQTESTCLEVPVKGTGGWTPVVLATADGRPAIDYVGFSANSSELQPLDIDDVAYSTVLQPDTAITRGPGALEYTFSSTVENPRFMCSLNRGEFAECKPTWTSAGLAPGEYTLAVYAVDVYDAADIRDPARVTFTVLPRTIVPPPPPADRDGDGVPDATDNCPETANSDQADGDADGVGNACDALPPGNVPPKPGETSVVKVVSGEVFVKLPTRTTLGFDGLRAPLQANVFVPLKGVASIPLGATVDTTRGEVAIDSAANSFSAADRRAKRQSARVRAALFLLKQRRAKARSASISTDVQLLSPPGAEARCAGAPPKGTVVRRISLVVKGYYRTLGGASTSTARSATFNTTDRCDGTLTEVGKGRVTVAVKKQKVTVKAGQAYLVKAKLFKLRKGRKPVASS